MNCCGFTHDLLESKVLTCFKTKLLDNGILLVGFDHETKPNVLDEESINEWIKISESAMANKTVLGVVVCSLKKDIFSAGADLEKIVAAKTRNDVSEVEDIVTKIHLNFYHMERSPKPFVAALDGAALGGGCELALACDWRVASERVVLKLPEVQFGIIPGFGGTQRLPRLVGFANAIDTILTGKNMYAYPALKCGLVDEVVLSVQSDERTLESVQKEALIQLAIKCAEDLTDPMISRNRKSKLQRKQRLSEKFFLLPVIRDTFLRVLFIGLEWEIQRKTKGFYPAPAKAIDVVQKGMKKSVHRASQDIEKHALCDLLTSSVSKKLIRLFLTGEEIKREARKKISSAVPGKMIGVLGAGLMGWQIANLLVEKGFTVVLKDLKQDILSTALSHISRKQKELLKKKIITKSEYERRMMNCIPTTEWRDFKTVPFVIEAIAERLEWKQKLLEEFEAVAAYDAVFASNTSSFTLEKIVQYARFPDRCGIMHFFNPPGSLQLVEVGGTCRTSIPTESKIYDVALALGKVMLTVSDTPGFLVNRVLSRYIAEAVILHAEGVPVQTIDRVATDFGMTIDSNNPMGPLKLIDHVGLPVAAEVVNSLQALGPRFVKHPLISDMLSSGTSPMKFWLPQKKGLEGFLRGRNINSDVLYMVFEKYTQKEKHMKDEDIMHRLMLPMVDEAFRCIVEGVVEGPRYLDFAMVQSVGFPAFRGGPIRWACETFEGFSEIALKLSALENEYGERFAPCEYLKQLRNSGREDWKIWYDTKGLVK